MKLISCHNCAIVLDQDRMNFPDSIYDEDGCVDSDKAVWDGNEFLPIANCPVCNSQIIKNE